MKQRGRKSVDALITLAQVRAEKRAEPPADLTPHQAALWRSVVSTKPGEWFRPDTYQILAAFCRHCSTAAVIDQEIDRFDPAWLREDGGLEQFRKLAEMRERQTRAIVSLARSMRLTQQARIHPVTAGRTGNLDPERRKPWEPLV
ncbi:MAG: hypothetical protein IPI75_08205 [Gammaproteobacteria bacterium]|nr:hypothetical protein [Gammaproteobacteria bacterium]